MCIEFLARFQYSHKIRVKSSGNIIERVCGELPEASLVRWAAFCFCLFVLTLQISIAVSQVCLAVSGVLYVAHLLRDKPVVRFLPVKLPLALFCLFSVLPIFWAENPTTGWFAVRKLVLFAVWFLVVNLVTKPQLRRRLLLLSFLVAAFTGLVAIGQFVIQYRDVRAQHPGEVYHYLTSTRIHGFMGHWMNFGGQQMLIFVFLLAFLLLANREEPQGWRASPALQSSRISTFEFQISAVWWVVLAIIIVSIILNFTRGVWLGCFVATVYLVVRWRAKWLWALPVLAALGYLLAPPLVRERLWLAAHPTQEHALSIRLEMWHVALNMVRAHPWVGVGPNNIEEVYNLYLPPGKMPEIGFHNHFHNDYLQFAAERGLPCLAAWLWLMAALGWHIWKMRRKLGPERWVADAALAALLAFLVEGCFEFNFGTSPVLMALLFLTALPFTAGDAVADSRRPIEK